MICLVDKEKTPQKGQGVVIVRGEPIEVADLEEEYFDRIRH